MEFTIQELGSVGELIGAVAVVVTLVYLSFQIKQNTLAVKAAAMQAIFAATNEVWRNSCIDLDRTKDFTAIVEKEDWTYAERTFFTGWVMQTIRAQENMYFHRKLGTVDEDFVRLDSRLKALFKLPHHKRAWGEGIAQPFVSDEFQDYVNKLISSDTN